MSEEGEGGGGNGFLKVTKRGLARAEAYPARSHLGVITSSSLNIHFLPPTHIHILNRDNELMSVLVVGHGAGLKINMLNGPKVGLDCSPIENWTICCTCYIQGVFF